MQAPWWFFEKEIRCSTQNNSLLRLKEFAVTVRKNPCSVAQGIAPQIIEVADFFVMRIAHRARNRQNSL
jgi:hypothetical protein